jgi:hypothetical protein
MQTRKGVCPKEHPSRVTEECHIATVFNVLQVQRFDVAVREDEIQNIASWYYFLVFPEAEGDGAQVGEMHGP